MKKILLKNLMPLTDVFKTEHDKDFKIHFARFNKIEEPLDVFLRSQNEIQKWNEYKNKKKRFHKYIFTLVKFYHEKDTWLFAGIYKVLSNDGEKHKVQLLTFGEEYIGRLKIFYDYKDVLAEPKLIKHFDGFEVKEILKERFVGREFAGYENVHLSFTELENIYAKEISSWKTSLQNIKGIYLITDKKNGKKYVGSAYEEKEGIWSRWNTYRKTGHGNNKQLIKILKKNSLNYAEKNFNFSLIEYYPLKVDNNFVIERETYWKEVLLTRQFGYNEN